MSQVDEPLQTRVRHPGANPTLVYLPGVQGDWTLVTAFSDALPPSVRFVEFTYPSTTEWSVADYASHLLAALRENGIAEGWLLAESFGSQVGWEILRQCRGDSSFKPLGIILAGGFVRHPWIPAAQMIRWLVPKVPWKVWSVVFAAYRRYARFRFRNCPVGNTMVEEFIARRTPKERLALEHRLELIIQNDPGPVARTTRLPVFSLTGLLDPLVPCWLVHRWLREHCPGYRELRVIKGADHNVLGTGGPAAVRQALKWIEEAGSAG